MSFVLCISRFLGSFSVLSTANDNSESKYPLSREYGGFEIMTVKK